MENILGNYCVTIYVLNGADIKLPELAWKHKWE